MDNLEATAKQTILAFVARMLAATEQEAQSARDRGDAITEEVARVCFGEFLDTYAALCGVAPTVETL